MNNSTYSLSNHQVMMCRWPQEAVGCTVGDTDRGGIRRLLTAFSIYVGSVYLGWINRVTNHAKFVKRKRMENFLFKSRSWQSSIIIQTLSKNSTRGLMLDYANHQWFFLVWIKYRNNTKGDLYIHSSSYGNWPNSLGWHSRPSKMVKIYIWFWSIIISDLL